MKAFDIIDELTRDSYENNGTFTADKDTTMYPYLQHMFGKEINVVYDKGDIFKAPVKDMKFYYSYNDRFVRTFDGEIYAILNDNDDLIYIYEVELYPWLQSFVGLWSTNNMSNLTQKAMKKTEVLFEMSSKYDSKHITNANKGRKVPQEILDEILAGCSLETLEKLLGKNFKVFKYKTQLTIHGEFPELSTKKSEVLKIYPKCYMGEPYTVYPIYFGDIFLLAFQKYKDAVKFRTFLWNNA